MPATFELGPSQMQWPAIHAASITPNDSADLAANTRGIYVGTGGDLRVTMAGGQTITFKSLTGGMVHPFCTTRVWATGTTASDIVGVY